MFPDASSVKQSRTSKVENLTAWEVNQESSDAEDFISSAVLSNQNTVKYIPINYLQYYDRASVESDEFTRHSTRSLSPPPPLTTEYSSSAGMILSVCLEVVSEMMSHAHHTTSHNILIQLGAVATNQMKVNIHTLSLIINFLVMFNT